MTFIQHQKSLSTYKKYYFLYYQILSSKFFSHAQPLRSLNCLRIQNPFAFHSSEQKWNGKFSFPAGPFLIRHAVDFNIPTNKGQVNTLVTRQRFIGNSLKGILLVNFPEKEKNFLIKNLAAENKIALITQSASLLLKDSRNMDDLLGVDDPIQILFDKVKTCIPCICFINNLDRIGKQRYQQEQKSLHWLNNSISLSFNKHLTGDPIFNTMNAKQNSDFFSTASSNKKSRSSKKFDLKKQSDLNKAFIFNNDLKNSAAPHVPKILKNIEKFQITRFKNVQNSDQKILKYLSCFDQPSNKNKLQSIRPFFNLLIKLSIGSKDFMYTHANKQSLLQFSIKKNIPYIIHYTLMFYKLNYYRCFLKKTTSYIQNKDNTLNEKYNNYQKQKLFKHKYINSNFAIQNSYNHQTILFKLSKTTDKNLINNVQSSPFYLSRKGRRTSIPAEPIFNVAGVKNMNFKFLSFTLPYLLKSKPFNTNRFFPNLLWPTKNSEKQISRLQYREKNPLFRRMQSRAKKSSLFTKQVPPSDRVFWPSLSKFSNSYYHRLPYWLSKNSSSAGPSFFQHKLNISKVKLFNWFYDQKKKEENILTSLQATVNPLLLQTAFCQILSARAEPRNTINSIFAKIDYKRVNPQTNLENFSKIPLLKNSLVKSNSTKMYRNKLKSISKKNIVSRRGLSRRGLSSKKKLSFKDLGKLPTNHKPIRQIFVDSNMQNFNFEASVFSKSFEKTNVAIFNDVSVNTKFKESISYDLSSNTKKEYDKNNSFKITETEIIKRTALLKFLQILDGFHTTTGKKKSVYRRSLSFFYFNILGLAFQTKNTLMFKDRYVNLKTNQFYPTLSSDPSFRSFFSKSIRLLTKKLEKAKIVDFHSTILPIVVSERNNDAAPPENSDNIRAISFNKYNIRFSFPGGAVANIFKNDPAGKLKKIKKSRMNNAIMLSKPFKAQTSLCQKIGLENNSLGYALPKKTFQPLRVASKIPKWEVYLKSQPSGKSLNLLCVWPSYIDDILGPLNDSASYILPEYFQLLGHGPKLKKQEITLIASTNNLVTLDAALLRPGRFDTIINFSHRLSSIFKSSKILKHSPSLIQNRIFSLSLNFPINKFNPSVSSLFFMNIAKTINNQFSGGAASLFLKEITMGKIVEWKSTILAFYSQITVLDVPSQSIPIKTFIDVSIFIQYKLWWNFHHEKLSWFGLYKKDLIQKPKRPKSLISTQRFCPSLFLKETTMRLRRKTDVLNFEKAPPENSSNGLFKANISGVILIFKFPIKKIKDVTYIFITILQIICFKCYNFFQYFMTFKGKLFEVKDENFFFRLFKIQLWRFPFILPFKPLQGEIKSKSVLSENSDINETKFTTQSFIINQSSNSINALSREVLTSRIINLKLPKNLSTLNSVLDQNYIAARTELCNFHMENSDMFLKFNRRLLFSTGDFDYKTYSKNNSEIILTKNLKSRFRIFTQCIDVTTAYLDQSEKIWKDNGKAESGPLPTVGLRNDNQLKIDHQFLNPTHDACFLANLKNKRSAIAIKNVNINNFRLTKYNEIYKLKKIKSKKQSFFNLHPFTSFMVQRWPKVIKSNKLKQHLKIPLVKTYLENPLNSPLYQENKMAFSVKNSWSSCFPAGPFDKRSLFNKIYHNTYSTHLVIPIPTLLLKKESLKTFATNSFPAEPFSIYESYLFKKLRTNFSLNIIGLQTDSTLRFALKQISEGEITNLKERTSNDFFARPHTHRETMDASRANNYKISLTCKNKISNVHLLEKKNLLKKIPRKTVINYTYDNFQTRCKFKYLENESKMNNNIILLKNLAFNAKKEHNFIKTRESFFQNSWPLFNKLNGDPSKMCRLDISFFVLIFYTMFFEKTQYKKLTFNTIKIFMPYRSLIFSYFLLSKASIYGFSSKNFEILIYNKFKNFLDL